MTRTRSITSKLAFISMIAIAASVIGCGTEPLPQSSTEAPHSVGRLGLNLTLPDGSILNTVSYSITGNGITPLTGSIPVQQAGATISAAISGVPAGSNYTVTLTGTTTNGKSSCLGVATFSITAGQTTQVSVGLQCRAGAATGTLVINGSINQCPSVTAFSVQPLQQTIPGTITVTSSASDPENSTLVYTWADSAHDGTFASASSASTTFTCVSKGTTTLTVSVDDGHGCTDSASVQVSCTSAAVCGDGVVGPGEQCDDGNTVNTDACVGPNCRTAVCGDGYVEAGVEACDNGAANGTPGNRCQANCTVTPGCGNGILDPGEECDGNLTPTGTLAAGQVCTSTCLLQYCGNNRVEGAEVCDGTVGATGALGLGQTCAANCASIVDNCLACENTNCTAYLGQPIDLVHDCYHDPNPTNVQLCVDAINCARTNNCAYTARGAEQCYCGTASSANCQLGTGIDGVCQAQFQAAATGDTATTPAGIAGYVTGHFGDRSLPIGNAVFMLQCDRDFCGAKVSGKPTQCVP
jgi:cysteine-rich repeat protein